MDNKSDAGAIAEMVKGTAEERKGQAGPQEVEKTPRND